MSAISDSRPLTMARSAQVSQNLEKVLERAAKAARRAGRAPNAVELVAVSKVHDVNAASAALAAGHRTFGESRVQEANEKWPALRAEFPDVGLHLIGHLQTNKVREAVRLFDVIETLDRPKLAAKLSEEMGRQKRQLPCFVQINTGEEPQRAGVLPNEADRFIGTCREAHGLDIQGLMCIPPKDEEPALHFAFLREIARRNAILSLSMGMSADFEIAIEMGATHVRLGSAIFGPRPTKGLQVES